MKTMAGGKDQHLRQNLQPSPVSLVWQYNTKKTQKVNDLKSKPKIHSK